MGRILRWTLCLALALTLLVLGLVNMLGSSPAGLEMPDPSTLIRLPSEAEVRLDALPVWSPEPPKASDGEMDAELSAVESAPGEQSTALAEYAQALPMTYVVSGNSWREDPDPGDPYELGEYHLWTTGEIEQAMALFQSVPASHPKYNVAMRRIGWEILTKERGDPRAGVAWINKSMRADSFDHDIWQDTYRVYARTLGIEVH